MRFPIGKVDDVKSGEAARFDVSGHSIAVIRIGDDFYALGDTCSHEDYSLSEGEVDEEECTVECWKHGSTFFVLKHPNHYARDIVAV